MESDHGMMKDRDVPLEDRVNGEGHFERFERGIQVQCFVEKPRNKLWELFDTNMRAKLHDIVWIAML